VTTDYFDGSIKLFLDLYLNFYIQQNRSFRGRDDTWVNFSASVLPSAWKISRGLLPRCTLILDPARILRHVCIYIGFSMSTIRPRSPPQFMLIRKLAQTLSRTIIEQARSEYFFLHSFCECYLQRVIYPLHLYLSSNVCISPLRLKGFFPERMINNA